MKTKLEVHNLPFHTATKLLRGFCGCAGLSPAALGQTMSLTLPLPSSLPSHVDVSYEHFFSALQRYASCEQRLGKWGVAPPIGCDRKWGTRSRKHPPLLTSPQLFTPVPPCPHGLDSLPKTGRDPPVWKWLERRADTDWNESFGKRENSGKTVSSMAHTLHIGFFWREGSNFLVFQWHKIRIPFNIPWCSRQRTFRDQIRHITSYMPCGNIYMMKQPFVNVLYKLFAFLFPSGLT